MATIDDGAIEHRHFSDLAALLRPGDVLAVNTSATLPAAVPVETSSGPGELHLSTRRPDGRWIVELRHPGRPASTPWLDARPGTLLHLPGGATAQLLAPSGPASADRPTTDRPAPADRPTTDRQAPADRPATDRAAPSGGSPAGVRLWVARLDLAQPVLTYLARYGRPIRYHYVDHDRPLGAYQTVFADQPGSAEMPSAARPFSAELVTRLVTRGVGFAPFVLHTGVSSLEAHEPPSAEWYRITAESAAAVNAARDSGHRVIAVGTTAVRTLETVADTRGRVHAGEGWTELVVTPERGVRAVDGLITGWHEPRASHLALLEAVAGRAILEASYRAALEEGYLWHEFGDSHLIIGSRTPGTRA